MTRILVVDDDARFVASLQSWLTSAGHEVQTAGSATEAKSAVDKSTPQLILLDFKLPDGSATDVLLHLDHIAPFPTVIVISGQADAENAFQLASNGVRDFVSKPVDPERLREVLERVENEAPRLDAQLKAAVGHAGVRDVEELVRRTMVDEAMAKTQGSRRSAARLLCVSRQALQHMLRRQ